MVKKMLCALKPCVDVVRNLKSVFNVAILRDSRQNFPRKSTRDGAGDVFWCVVRTCNWFGLLYLPSWKYESICSCWKEGLPGWTQTLFPHCLRWVHCKAIYARPSCYLQCGIKSIPSIHVFQTFLLIQRILKHKLLSKAFIFEKNCNALNTLPVEGTYVRT